MSKLVCTPSGTEVWLAIKDAETIEIVKSLIQDNPSIKSGLIDWLMEDDDHNHDPQENVIESFKQRFRELVVEAGQEDQVFAISGLDYVVVSMIISGLVRSLEDPKKSEPDNFFRYIKAISQLIGKRLPKELIGKLFLWWKGFSNNEDSAEQKERLARQLSKLDATIDWKKIIDEISSCPAPKPKLDRH